MALAFVAKINDHDVNGLVELMTADHVFVDRLSTTFRGAEQMRQGWKMYFSLFPDYAIEVTDEFERGDVVAMFGKAHGTFAVNGKSAEREFLGNSRRLESRRKKWTRAGMARLLRQRSGAQNHGGQRASQNQPLTSADELNDLKGVVWLDPRLIPIGPWQDIQVSLDCHAIARHAQVFQHPSDIQAIRDFASFTVNRYRHCAAPAVGLLPRVRIAKRISSFHASACALITNAKSPLPSGGSGKWMRTRPCSSLVPE